MGSALFCRLDGINRLHDQLQDAVLSKAWSHANDFRECSYYNPKNRRAEEFHDTEIAALILLLLCSVQSEGLSDDVGHQLGNLPISAALSLSDEAAGNDPCDDY